MVSHALTRETQRCTGVEQRLRQEAAKRAEAAATIGALERELVAAASRQRAAERATRDVEAALSEANPNPDPNPNPNPSPNPNPKPNPKPNPNPSPNQ